MDPHGVTSRRRASSVGSRTADHLGAIGEDPAEDQDCHSEAETVTSQNTEGNREANNFLSRPYWLSDEGLKKGEIDVLSLQEELFWKDLLEKYLYPIDEDKAEKVRSFNQTVVIRSFVFFYFLKFEKNFCLSLLSSILELNLYFL